MTKDIGYYLSLMTKGELKIYKAVLTSFPATNPLSAVDIAFAGGTNFHFISK